MRQPKGRATIVMLRHRSSGPLDHGPESDRWSNVFRPGCYCTPRSSSHADRSRGSETSQPARQNGPYATGRRKRACGTRQRCRWCRCREAPSLPSSVDRLFRGGADRMTTAPTSRSGASIVFVINPNANLPPISPEPALSGLICRMSRGCKRKSRSISRR
jgi:hypothetical protein